MSDYVAFCAEGNAAAGGPLQSIACVSLPAAMQPSFSFSLSSALSSGDTSQPSPAIRLVDATLAALGSGVRLDVLMWDEREPRNFLAPHDGTGLEAMSYHLLTAAMRTRPPASSWRIHYGRREGARWPTLADCTETTARSGPPERLLFVDFARTASHAIREAAEVDERDSLEAQLAGLFAALIVFSRASHARFEAWASAGTAADAWGAALGPSEVESFGLIAHLNAEAKRAKLGVSLSSTRGLRTLDGRRSLNFWWYEAIGR